MALLLAPWPWYVSGIIIGLIVPATLFLGNKPFGISSSLRHLCAIILPGKISYFKYDWKKESWNLFFIFGIVFGAFLSSAFFQDNSPPEIADSTKKFLIQHAVYDFSSLTPADIFSWPGFFTLRGFICIVIGGFLVGFGTRYANGCTSGHSISGLANLQMPSLIATVCFMAGGIIVTWFILPLILNL